MWIALDPGHGKSNRIPGLYDPGAVGRLPNGELVAEADVVLKYALTLKQSIIDRGHEVVLTRTSSADSMPLSRRAPFAQQHGCSRFISIHCNASTSHQGTGSETWYRTNPGFAGNVQRALVAGTGLRDRGTKQSSKLSVLKFNGAAVLLELGFIDHMGDLQILLDRDTRIRTCDLVAQAVTGDSLPGVGDHALVHTIDAGKKLLESLQSVYRITEEYAPAAMAALNSFRNRPDISRLVELGKR